MVPGHNPDRAHPRAKIEQNHSLLRLSQRPCLTRPKRGWELQRCPQNSQAMCSRNQCLPINAAWGGFWKVDIDKMGSDLAKRPSENAPRNCDSSGSEKSNDSSRINGVCNSGLNCKAPGVSPWPDVHVRLQKTRPGYRQNSRCIKYFEPAEGNLWGWRGMGSSNWAASRKWTHQNTVCLRVSQFEGVAETATKHDSLKKRMAANMYSWKTIGCRKVTSELSETKTNDTKWLSARTRKTPRTASNQQSGPCGRE